MRHEAMKKQADGTAAGAASATAPSNPCEGGAGAEKKSINPELWQACAGPLVNLPPAGTHVVYFPQGHSEQVAASLKKDVDGQIPNYPNLPSKLLCLLHNFTLHADPKTDEVYAQMTLQPVPFFDKACWNGGCYDSDMLAAFDAAVADGVDVVLLSVGGEVMLCYLDAVAISAFTASKAGVFVASSAGNNGPSSLTVTNIALG